MAILDFLSGQNQLEKQKSLADDFVNRYYDSSVYNPQLDEARMQASEGIDDENIRSQGVQSIFASTQTPMTVSQGSSLAALQQFNEARTSALAELEGNIGIAEEQAKREGRSQGANIMSQMRQTEAQRRAGLAQNRLDIEAEAQRRKGMLGSGLGKLAGIAASVIPGVGPLASAAIGTVAGGIFGGTQGAVSGGVSGIASGLQQKQYKDLLAQNEAMQSEQQFTINDLMGFLSGSGMGMPSALNYEGFKPRNDIS